MLTLCIRHKTRYEPFLFTVLYTEHFAALSVPVCLHTLVLYCYARRADKKLPNEAHLRFEDRQAAAFIPQEFRNMVRRSFQTLCLLSSCVNGSLVEAFLAERLTLLFS